MNPFVTIARAHPCTFSARFFFNTPMQDRQKPIYVVCGATLPWAQLLGRLWVKWEDAWVGVIGLFWGWQILVRKVHVQEGQTLKAFWPYHLQLFYRKVDKSQTLKACWPCHVVQALIEILTKCQTLKACWPCHIVQALIKILTKSQTLKMSRCQASDWSRVPKSNFEGLMAIWHCPESDWNTQKTNFEALLAMLRCRGSDWNEHQKSNFEGLLAMWHSLGSDRNPDRKSSFEDLLAMSHCPGSD